MFMFDGSMLMLHGAIFPRYTNVSTRRGHDRIDAPNWIMGMYSHPLGDTAQFGARLMMSLDPLTEGGRGRDTVYFRWERVEKSGHELVLNRPDESRIFPVSGYTIGYVRDLSHGNGLDIGLGTQFTINRRPDTLDRYYGDDLGYAFEFFLRIRPSLHSHGAHEHSEHAVAGMEK